jgi:excisionase family DNA binding protein
MTMKLLKVDDVATRLGASKRHVHALIASRRLRAVDISIKGRAHFRITEDALANFIAGREAGPPEPRRRRSMKSGKDYFGHLEA